MTQYNNLMELNKLKSATKEETGVTLKLLSKIIVKSNGEANFSHALVLTDRQVSKFWKAFENNLSANVKLSKTQLYKIVQQDFLLDFSDRY